MTQRNPSRIRSKRSLSASNALCPSLPSHLAVDAQNPIREMLFLNFQPQLGGRFSGFFFKRSRSLASSRLPPFPPPPPPLHRLMFAFVLLPELPRLAMTTLTGKGQGWLGQITSKQSAAFQRELPAVSPVPSASVTCGGGHGEGRRGRGGGWVCVCVLGGLPKSSPALK